ncbi:ferredoxin Fer [Halegenticoccus tardaugens]|uniref:ferredoxin Fer n=1 Tax=Halegenticoccus tardaugens TaxID=2071624 RepID=UPI00100BA22D|nr:ferredoxin Fer [Halegenticoccus tardaugens]
MDFDLPAVKPSSESTDAEDRSPSKVTYLHYRAIVANDWDIEDDDLFEKAAKAKLDHADYGVIEAERNESLLRSAEENDLKWPFQCRSGTCAMCTGVVVDGDAEMEMNLFLEDEEIDEMNLRLTCTCFPESDEVKIVCGAIQTDYVRDIARNRG